MDNTFIQKANQITYINRCNKCLIMISDKLKITVMECKSKIDLPMLLINNHKKNIK